MLNRAYSLLEVKDFDPVRRTFGGTATSPVPDRVGDTIDSAGVTYKNPLPLLLYHNSQKPVGTANFKRAAKGGVTPFDAIISTIDRDSGVVKERLDEAVDSLAAKPPLIRGVSIGFRPLEDPVFNKETGGFHFPKIEVLELSMVVIPAHQDATIATIKSLDAPFLATHPGADESTVNHPHRQGTPVVRLLPTRQEKAMKSIQEQIVSFKSTRDQKFTELNELVAKSGEAGQTPDAADAETCDTLESEIASLDKHIKRLESVQSLQKDAAVPAAGNDPHAAHVSRGGSGATPVIHVRSNSEPGIDFTRAMICKLLAFKYGGSPVDYAKQRYPDNDGIQTHLKATVPAAGTVDQAWAGVFVDPTNLTSQFIEYLRPQTIIGKFGTNGIPALNRVPFNVRILGQTSGGDGYWVGQGAPKPLTKFDFNATTLGFTKVAAISVITEELIRFSSPSAEARIRDGLVKANIARIDTDFIDPTVAAVSNVSPASLTNGLTALAPSGTSADAARADLARLIREFLDENNDPTSLVIIMPTALALALSIQRNSLGQKEFDGLTMRGGMLEGIPVITSQYAANQSGAGNLVIAVNASDVLLADDGQVTVDASREASLQMLDNPTNNSVTGTATSMVSMFQTNSVALRAERFINWQKARASAVAYMDDVNWGSIGSPA